MMREGTRMSVPTIVSARHPTDRPDHCFVDRGVHTLDVAVETDVIGASILSYARTDAGLIYSRSVRALCQRLGRVTIDPLALAEALTFGFTLGERTIVHEIRTIPAGGVLEPDGAIRRARRLASTGEITDPVEAAVAVRGALDAVVAEYEPRWQVHGAGLTAGRDSRILAALPKRYPERWHWVSVSGRGDTEQIGALEVVRHLRLQRHIWLEWMADFLDGDSYRVSAELSGGVGAVSDFAFLRHAFGRYRDTVLADVDSEQLAFWLGTFADGLLGGTWLAAGEADTLWKALAPTTTALTAIASPRVVDAFAAERAAYDAQPFEFDVARPEETGGMIRLLTQGRLFVGRAIASFDAVCRHHLHPFLHPEVLDVALRVDAPIRAADAVREGVLRNLDPALAGPSEKGYHPPAYLDRLGEALCAEARRCEALDGLVRSELAATLRAGELPPLVAADGSPVVGAYRDHVYEPRELVRSLRAYEHLLNFVSFINLIVEDGVAVTVA